ncbi:hypothetical protein AKJ16_DCAP08484 [Drosera capensis]
MVDNHKLSGFQNPDKCTVKRSSPAFVLNEETSMTRSPFSSSTDRTWDSETLLCALDVEIWTMNSVSPNLLTETEHNELH